MSGGWDGAGGMAWVMRQVDRELLVRRHRHRAAENVLRERGDEAEAALELDDRVVAVVVDLAIPRCCPGTTGWE